MKLGEAVQDDGDEALGHMVGSGVMKGVYTMDNVGDENL